MSTVVDGKKVYKVVGPNGESLHGGSMTWSVTGDWHKTEGPLVMCVQGFHLTSEPAKWWKPSCRVFEVEAVGLLESNGSVAWNEDKVVAKECRLARELSQEELVEVRIVRFGVHEFKTGGILIVEGSATVTASGSATVRASGSATVTASGSATVRALNKSLVTAFWGSATVNLEDEAVFVDRRSGPPKIEVAK